MSGFNMQKFHHTAGQVFAIDPICEMKVDPQNPPFKITHEGKAYYFCSKVCKHLFEREPKKYVQQKEMKNEQG